MPVPAAVNGFHKEASCLDADVFTGWRFNCIGGEVPKTSSIRKLFGFIYQLTKDEVFKYDRKALLFLESAYLNSRYFSFVYEKEDAKEALKIAVEVKDLVENVRDDDKNE